MNRDDNLQKYRDENIDEGWESVHKEGLACGYIAYAIVMFLMFLINYIRGYWNPFLQKNLKN